MLQTTGFLGAQFPIIKVGHRYEADVITFFCAAKEEYFHSRPNLPVGVATGCTLTKDKRKQALA